MLWALIVCYAIVTVLAFILAERVMFMPPPASYDADDASFTRIGVGGDDSVAVIHMPHPSARYTILYSHGNAEDLGHVLPILRRLQRAGFGILAYDYRGYGRSTRLRPTVRRAAEDAVAVYRFAIDELGIPADRLIVHGRSLGSGPSLELAANHPVAGIVLESAFTSAYRVLTRVGLLPFDRFPNARHIRNVRVPVLVIHGTRDEVIPVAHGRSLFSRASGPKQSLWVEGAGHNDLVHVAQASYTSALVRFAALIEAHAERLESL